MKRMLLIGEAGTGKSLLASKIDSDVEVVEKQTIHSKDELEGFDQVFLFNVINTKTVEALGLVNNLDLPNLRYFAFTKNELLNNDINSLIKLRRGANFVGLEQEQESFLKHYKKIITDFFENK